MWEGIPRGYPQGGGTCLILPPRYKFNSKNESDYKRKSYYQRESYYMI